MDTPEPRRPLIGRLRRALLGTRAGTIGSAARNVDSLVTSGHQHLDSDSDSESGSVVDADADARQGGAPPGSGR